MDQRVARLAVFVLALGRRVGHRRRSGRRVGAASDERRRRRAAPDDGRARHERGGPTVTIRSDGIAVIQTTLRGPGHAAPEPLVFRIDEAGLQRVLRGAESAGLLRHTDYGRRVVGDARLSAGQRSARAALRVFAGRVTDPSFYRGTLASH